MPSRNLNLEELQEKGSWGPFHEIGHNMQSNLWTFDGMYCISVFCCSQTLQHLSLKKKNCISGTKEVTCNVFAMYAQEMLTGQPAWDSVMGIHINLFSYSNIYIVNVWF